MYLVKNAYLTRSKLFRFLTSFGRFAMPRSEFSANLMFLSCCPSKTASNGTLDVHFGSKMTSLALKNRYSEFQQTKNPAQNGGNRKKRISSTDSFSREEQALLQLKSRRHIRFFTWRVIGTRHFWPFSKSRQKWTSLLVLKLYVFWIHSSSWTRIW
jgi:hypothetical protein